MKPPNPQERLAGSPFSTPVREGISGNNPTIAQSLPLAEIESLLRLARENARKQTIAGQDEVLGPGDVQHLRGDSIPNPFSTVDAQLTTETFASQSSPEVLLQRAQQQLADAILDDEPIQAAAVSPPPAKLSSPSSNAQRLTPRPGLTLEDLGDVDLDISIELGRAEILIEDVLKLREGSVVSLDKLAGDPVDIVANGRLVARGELLVIDGKFGVRLSEVL